MVGSQRGTGAALGWLQSCLCLPQTLLSSVAEVLLKQDFGCFLSQNQLVLLVLPEKVLRVVFTTLDTKLCVLPSQINAERPALSPHHM